MGPGSWGWGGREVRGSRGWSWGEAEMRGSVAQGLGWARVEAALLPLPKLTLPSASPLPSLLTCLALMTKSSSRYLVTKALCFDGRPSG